MRSVKHIFYDNMISSSVKDARARQRAYEDEGYKMTGWHISGRTGCKVMTKHIEDGER